MPHIARRSFLRTAAAVPFLGLADAQQPLDARRQVTSYLERAARDITDRAAAEIRNRDTWERLRPRRLEEMRDMLGLLPWPRRTPLNVRITGTLDRGTYIIEKIAFESLPKIYVTANLYRPKAIGAAH